MTMANSWMVRPHHPKPSSAGHTVSEQPDAFQFLLPITTPLFSPVRYPRFSTMRFPAHTFTPSFSAAGRVIGVGTCAAGQLGRGLFTASTSSLPASIPNGIRVNSLAVSAVDDDAYVVALAFNSTANKRILIGWGANQASSMAGFSGVPTNLPRELTYVANDLQNRVPISISASHSHTNVQTDTGYLTWTATSNAANGAGVFGLNVYDEPIDIRNRIPFNDNFTMIKTCPNSDPATYGVLANNVIMRWGRGYSDPIQLTYPSLSKIVDIAVGRAFVVLLNELGEAWTHGTNAFRELGNVTVNTSGSTELRVVRVTNLQGNVISVAATETNGFAVKGDGSLWFWGTLPGGAWADYGADFSSSSAIALTLTNTFGGGPIPPFKAVYTAAAFSNYASTLQNSIFLLDTSGTLYSFGANEYGQLCRGIAPSSSSFVDTAGVVSLPQGETVSSVTFAYGMSSVLTNSGNLYACGFDGSGFFSARTDYLNYGFFNDSFSVTTLKQVTIPPGYNYANPRPFASVSHLIGGIYAVTQDNVLVTCFRNASCGTRSDDATISSRRISVVSAFGYGSFVTAGPLEPVSYADVIPSTAQFIRIQGRGFPALVRPVVPSDRLQLHLSEGSCTVSLSAYEYSVNGTTPYLLCKVDSGVTFSLGSTLTGVLSVRGDVSDPFVIGRVVAGPQVLGDFNTQYIAWGGERVLEIQGSAFGTVPEHVQVKVLLSEFNAPPAPCNVIYVDDSSLKCELSVPQNQYGYIYVQVTRLFAVSSDNPASWGQLSNRS
jgi:alpha-tubulin suppressor-like RCC1 family protein